MPTPQCFPEKRHALEAPPTTANLRSPDDSKQLRAPVPSTTPVHNMIGMYTSAQSLLVYRFVYFPVFRRMLVLLDIFSIKTNGILFITTIMTIIGGDVVYAEGIIFFFFYTILNYRIIILLFIHGCTHYAIAKIRDTIRPAYWIANHKISIDIKECCTIFLAGQLWVLSRSIGWNGWLSAEYFSSC